MDNDALKLLMESMGSGLLGIIKILAV